MHKPALNLHDLIEAVAPVEHVSVERWDDRSTWRVTLAPDATAEQRAAAEAVMRAFDPSAVAAAAPTLPGETPRPSHITVAPVVKDEELAARVAHLEGLLSALAAEARRST
jgi:5,10-methylenetetrahydrofolate reductase